MSKVTGDRSEPYWPATEIDAIKEIWRELQAMKRRLEAIESVLQRRLGELEHP